MENIEIRERIRKKRLRHYEVAKACGIAPETLSIWLRYELTPEHKERIERAIASIKI